MAAVTVLPTAVRRESAMITRAAHEAFALLGSWDAQYSLTSRVNSLGASSGPRYAEPSSTSTEPLGSNWLAVLA